ncbi:hypothetical protein [Rhodoferax saidenbachensis]|uniref:Uncharacterized protein YxeA n=1 Tax=Rhodoferax saidenbachensis TaxID=1484693 RepID=A0ABU1ZHH4_9BURK|nr:hypothetical protein [Rhodoferax saidenbachensis]MDR7304985.1 uncharacterized protein YxeA [Rhodoferax saidenbachensis]
MSTILVIVIVLLVAVFGGVAWWKLFNTPDGERYLKMRTQGPFAPIHSDGTDPAQADDKAI